MPIAVIGSVLIAGTIYVLLPIAFTGAAPTSGLHKGWAGLSFAAESV